MTERTDREIEQMFELDGSPGPARPIDDKRAAAIVAAAVAGAGFGPVGGGGGGLARGKLVLLAGAAALAIAMIAWIATRGPGPVAESSEVPSHAIDAALVAVAAPPPVVVPPSDAPAVVEEAPAIVEPSPITVEPKRSPATPKPEDLLAEANAERTAHAWSKADALYARVVALPHAPKLAAQTALVASASLHLEHLADPRGATRRFRAALAIGPNGALAEDARWGIAEAARANHDAAAERAALDEFLAKHADSPLASRARARRAEL